MFDPDLNRDSGAMASRPLAARPCMQHVHSRYPIPVLKTPSTVHLHILYRNMKYCRRPRYPLSQNSGYADDLNLAREFLPHDERGHLLLTTRARALGGLAERLSIGQMQPEEGALLLLRRAGLVAKDASLAAGGTRGTRRRQGLSQCGV